MKNEIIELILTESAREDTPEPAVQSSQQETRHGVVVGTIEELRESGEPVVRFDNDAGLNPSIARSILPITRKDIGRHAVVTFERGDVKRPIIVGLLQPLVPIAQDVELDGERLTFTAEKEIVLKCGESSITLTRAGKVLIRGAYLSSRSSGVNRIKGGSVQIN